jgi:hypothetical protein
MDGEEATGGCAGVGDRGPSFKQTNKISLTSGSKT